MTLGSHSAVEGVTIHKHTLLTALAMGLQHIDVGDRVLATQTQGEN